MIAAYRHPDRVQGRQLMTDWIGSISSGIPTTLVEIRRLGRTLKRRTADVLAYFDRPGAGGDASKRIDEPGLQPHGTRYN